MPGRFGAVANKTLVMLAAVSDENWSSAGAAELGGSGFRNQH
jgi:hypothetical protein